MVQFRIKPIHLSTLAIIGGIFLAAFFVSTSASGGASAEFNGTNSILVAPSSPSLTLTSDFTLEAWIKILREPAPGQSYALITKWEPNQNQRSYLWFYGKNPDGTKHLTFCTSPTGGPVETNVCRGAGMPLFPEADLGANEWHHLAVRFINDTSPSGQMVLFVDGVGLDGQQSMPPPAVNESPFTIGAGRFADGTLFFPCNCRMDEVRVWNIARSNSEISLNRAKELIGNEPNLAGYWRFNNTFADASPNHNDLTPVNVVFSSDSAPVEPLDGNFVIFAEKEIKLEKGAQISSGNLGSNDKLDIEKDALVSGNISADKITLDKNTSINGNALYNNLKIHKDAQILGTKTTPVTLPIFSLPPVPDFKTGTRDLTFMGENNVLPQGQYRNITVEKDSALFLPGGIYNISKLELKKNAKIVYATTTAPEIVARENFEDEELGSLRGQNGWVISPDSALNFIVQDEIASEGKRAVRASCVAPCPIDQSLGKTITDIAETVDFTTISFDFRVDGGFAVVSTSDRSFRTVFAVFRDIATGDFRLLDGVGSQIVTIFPNSSLGRWYHFDVHIDLERQRVQARVNNGPWSSFISFISPIASVNNVHLRVGSSFVPTQVDTLAYYDSVAVTVQKPTPTVLNIQRELKGQEGVSIIPDRNVKPEDLVINYLGRNTKAEIKANKKGADGGVKPVEFGKNSFLNFKLFAPEASVHIGKESTLRGQVLAKKVKVGKGSVVSREEAFLKESDPGKIVTDTFGDQVIVNEIVLVMVSGATVNDAQQIANVIGGRITAVIDSLNLYKIEVSAASAQELNNFITTIQNLNDPRVELVTTNNVMGLR